MIGTFIRVFAAPFLAGSLLAGSELPSSEELDAEWKPLFREDLSDAITSDGVWSVENGVLTATEDRNIWSNAVYQGFALQLEFRNSEGTNSGVVIYCDDMENWIPNSVEIQIADDHSEPWRSADPSWQCGAFFGHRAPDKSGVVAPAGEWNRMKVFASGQRIAVELNGELVNAIDLSRYSSAEVAPDGTRIPEWLSKPWAELTTRGYIGFQGKHAGAPIEFRNIRIRAINELERAGLSTVAREGVELSSKRF